MLAKDQARAGESTLDFIGRVLHEYLGDRKELIVDEVEEWVNKIKLPWWVPSFMVRRILDWIIPNQLISLVIALLRRAGLE